MKPIFKIMFLTISLIICGIAVAGYFSPEVIAHRVEMSDFGALIVAAPIAVASIGTFNADNLKIPLAEFEQLKAKHGKLYVIDIQIDEDEKYQYIVCRPTRNLLSAIAKYKDDLDKANDLILKNMVVAGDMEALEDGIVFARLMKDTAKIIQQGTSFLFKA